MQETNFLAAHTWQPFARFNFTHPFFSLNRETVISTWIVLAIIILLSLLTWFIKKKRTGVIKYLIVTSIQSFIDLTTQTLGHFNEKHFYFCTALFFFIALCNCITVLPWTEEPTADINTTLAMGILSFLYVQWYAIRAHGLLSYLKEYFTPVFFMFPLHLIGKLSSIISLSFRLFGNIFGGSVIARIFLNFVKGSLILETIGLPVNLVITFFFVLFEGFLQAFVFAMLSLTYLAIAVAHHEESQIGDVP